MISGFITAIRTLTRLPIKGKEANNYASSLPWFPVVGFILASVLNLIIFGIKNFIYINWNEIIALIILLTDILLTGALHLDGFADWADSLGAQKNKEKMLEIMKDSNVGAFGVIAIVLFLLTKWILLIKLLEFNLAIEALFIAYISSRFAMVYFSVNLPYAREEGLGKAFIENASSKHLSLAFIVSLILLFLSGSVFAIVFFFLCFPIMLLWKIWCKKNLNGITGDLLGAGSEFVEIFVLTFLTLFYKNTLIFLDMCIKYIYS